MCYLLRYHPTTDLRKPTKDFKGQKSRFSVQDSLHLDLLNVCKLCEWTVNIEVYGQTVQMFYKLVFCNNIEQSIFFNINKDLMLTNRNELTD